MAKARPIPRLSADEAYSRAGARIVSVRAAELREHAENVLDVSEIEHLHDMRVASRRLRAALEIFEPCFSRRPYRAALKEVKAIADALGERRDRDVTIVALHDFAAAMPAPDRPGIQSLIESVRAEQAEANETLGAHVSAERLDSLDRRLRDLVSEANGAGE
jgi:CHAD domain-containing protein